MYAIFDFRSVTNDRIATQRYVIPEIPIGSPVSEKNFPEEFRLATPTNHFTSIAD